MCAKTSIMKTNIDLDDRLIEQAFALTGLRTKKELINFAKAKLVKTQILHLIREKSKPSSFNQGLTASN